MRNCIKVLCKNWVFGAGGVVPAWPPEFKPQSHRGRSMLPRTICFHDSSHSYSAQNKLLAIFFGMRTVLCVRCWVVQCRTPRMIHFHQKIIHLGVKSQHGPCVPGCLHCYLKKTLVSMPGRVIAQSSSLGSERVSEPRIMWPSLAIPPILNSVFSSPLVLVGALCVCKGLLENLRALDGKNTCSSSPAV